MASPQLQSPDAIARLGVLIGYPTEEIVETLVRDCGLNEPDAGALVARVQEANPL